MCEVHFYKCGGCSKRWTEHRRLASCESEAGTAKCPDSLCMYVGSARRPQRGECQACEAVREEAEVEAEEEEEEEEEQDEEIEEDVVDDDDHKGEVVAGTGKRAGFRKKRRMPGEEDEE